MWVKVVTMWAMQESYMVGTNVSMVCCLRDTINNIRFLWHRIFRFSSIRNGVVKIKNKNMTHGYVHQQLHIPNLLAYVYHSMENAHIMPIPHFGMVCLLLHNTHRNWIKLAYYIGNEMPTSQCSNWEKTWQKKCGLHINMNWWSNSKILQPCSTLHYSFLHGFQNNMPPLAPFHVHPRG